jgi:integrase
LYSAPPEPVRAKLVIDATAYGFRHSFATDALSNGVPEAHVAALLGHSSTTMLHRHYSHVGAGPMCCERR